jgi:hypothetical protein
VDVPVREGAISRSVWWTGGPVDICNEFRYFAPSKHDYRLSGFLSIIRYYALRHVGMYSPLARPWQSQIFPINIRDLEIYRFGEEENP